MIPLVVMNPAGFLSRALLFLRRVLCFSFLVAVTHEDNLDDSTTQFSPREQIPHPAQERDGSDRLVLGEGSSESTVGNKTECIRITRKFRAMNSLSER